MLNIILEDYLEDKHIPIVLDVEKEFAKLKIVGTETDRILIRAIENGEYVDDVSYIDRFGFKLPIDDLSTGCKAALCVENIPNKVISLLECGNNARDTIIRYCKQGAIVIRDNGRTISTVDGVETQSVINGKRFDDIDQLNKYINNRIGDQYV